MANFSELEKKNFSQLNRSAALAGLESVTQEELERYTDMKEQPESVTEADAAFAREFERKFTQLLMLKDEDATWNGMGAFEDLMALAKEKKSRLKMEAGRSGMDKVKNDFLARQRRAARSALATMEVEGQQLREKETVLLNSEATRNQLQAGYDALKQEYEDGLAEFDELEGVYDEETLAAMKKSYTNPSVGTMYDEQGRPVYENMLKALSNRKAHSSGNYSHTLAASILLERHTIRGTDGKTASYGENNVYRDVVRGISPLLNYDNTSREDVETACDQIYVVQHGVHIDGTETTKEEKDGAINGMLGHIYAFVDECEAYYEQHKDLVDHFDADLTESMKQAPYREAQAAKAQPILIWCQVVMTGGSFRNDLDNVNFSDQFMSLPKEVRDKVMDCYYTASAIYTHFKYNGRTQIFGLAKAFERGDEILEYSTDKVVSYPRYRETIRQNLSEEMASLQKKWDDAHKA